MEWNLKRLAGAAASLLVTLCLGSSALAEPQMPDPTKPDVSVTEYHIDNAYGPPGAPSTFYGQEDVQVKVWLTNHKQANVTVGSFRRQEDAAWCRDVALSMVRVEPNGKRTPVRIRQEMVSYLPPPPRPGHEEGVLYMGEAVETQWRLTLEDGAPLPEGEYLVDVGRSDRWRVASQPKRIRVIRAPKTRIDQLNALHHTAVNLRFAGRYAEALAVLNELVEACPGSPIAHAEIGGVYRDTGEYRKAIASYEKAIALYEGGPCPPRNRGRPCPLNTTSRV